ncbi:MAG TPA: phosphoribosyltransferase family protein [Terracidiphilus sp.]|nr:phosphoribosyltransferase family protein [Terracidiphilus sp.]
MLFDDRSDAGRTLARIVAKLPNLENAIVLGLPRGGVPVAFEVALACRLPFDVLLARKLGVPLFRELAFGAVASGGAFVLNREVLREFRISKDMILSTVRREMEEIEWREHEYRQAYPRMRIEGKTVILVDDGLATGATMKAAVRAVRPQAASVVVAVPVAAPSSCSELARVADQVLCVVAPDCFDAVGRYYLDFRPTIDEEVIALLAKARASTQAQPAV